MQTPAPAAASPRPDTSLGPALEALGRRDADLARAYAACGLPRVRRQPQGFAGLARIVVEQQLSTASARAIIGRLESQVRPLTPQNLLRRKPEALVPVGLSRQKTRTLLALAADIIDGRIDLSAVAAMDDERVIEHLMQASGVGRTRMIEIAEGWRPYRSAAARLLWHFFRHPGGTA
ncbi:MAG: hypothetical protein QF902_09715 [Rhodospirillales bacterium]|jgi:DNA-3-methyladenine glycosylase II|nr:hypothetical protein [Rhodospirillales bacterium]